MTSIEEQSMKEISESLFNFAIARDDIKKVLKGLPESPNINPVAVEYEIQLLKILSVGWSISFIMDQHPDKTKIAEGFWNYIQEFSKGISTITSSTTGKDIDYFNILRERVDIYVKALNYFSDVNDPAMVIGPTFAKLCGSEEDLNIIESGKKIFNLSIAGVKIYLESLHN